MCRIAGIIGNKWSKAEVEDGLQRMCDAMQKGGPDGFGYQTLPELNLAFGHRRLSLIDLSENGKQPMAYGKHLWITFNGEIYNYQELKADLISKGFTFQNQTDTEVILAGYEAYGTDFFKELKGMFAFALVDQKARQTFLVRDEIGIKPLYYYSQSNELYFASEVKAFKALDPNWKENKDWPIYFLSFGFVPEPYTTLDGVYNLAKGHFLTWDHAKQQCKTQQFSGNYPNAEQTTQPEAIKQTETNLDKAVKRHLIADAPIGVFLSGGIDSSLLSIIANEQNAQTITTVSINFNEPEFSEQSYQQIIAEQIGSEHISYTVTANDFEQNIAQIFQDMDQPSNDGINSWFVNKVAKENGLKAVLSGIGADELFGGYPSFKRHELIKKLKKLPRFLLKSAKHLPNDKLKRISFLAYKNPIGEYLFLRGFYTPNVVGKLLGISEKQVTKLLSSYPTHEELELLNAEDRIAWFECNIYMQNQLLKDTDYMSMAHGIEVRVPFLDQDVVTGAKQLPTNKRFNQQPKSLLIEAYRNLLPEAIWNRPKKGFTFPFQHWFGSYQPMLNTNHYQNNPQALRLLKQFKDNKLHWSKLFAVYQVFYHARQK
ncbi:asparagine synthase (glutamine-hydrolyzing) [Pedobacter xixiisoli]|uniref:asparagine synthase (glutamine-hydrolyzing) n=1 Tax=Pedobacter xixiisoli TaxID=1476464 RepID=A0A286A9S9_9SPHI|nr:asparagine synthase (glutamine-hydrolyzing) [Pedobacter xixiisoli]SOD18670.1 asparagine synthase (glutamine-hydrolysing) [Pedobacter xixiisoli]